MLEIKMNEKGWFDVYEDGKILFEDISNRDDALDMVEDHVNGIHYRKVEGGYVREELEMN